MSKRFLYALENVQNGAIVMVSCEPGEVHEAASEVEGLRFLVFEEVKE